MTPEAVGKRRNLVLGGIALALGVGAIGLGLWERADRESVEDRTQALAKLAPNEVAARTAEAWGPFAAGTPARTTKALGPGWAVRYAGGPAATDRFAEDHQLDVLLQISSTELRNVCVTLSGAVDGGGARGDDGMCPFSVNDPRSPYLKALTTTTTAG